jgi:CRISPR-associated protein Cas1
VKDLHELPKLRDSLSYLYVEHAVVERNNHAVELNDIEGKVLVPAANLCVLMLGPGTSITHAAVKVLSENGCTVVWTGEGSSRFYAQGTGETRKAYHLLKQAQLASNPAQRREVVLRMYQKRFDELLDPGLTLPQIRGLEGVRVRQTYKHASEHYGVEWKGRRYDRSNWEKSDPINRALSAANALLNGICHAAIVSGGYSTAIGFIHTGKQLSFVYDIADLYKAEFTIPTAFKTVSESSAGVEARVRQGCREVFRERKLLTRILPEIDKILDIHDQPEALAGDIDTDSALPEPLWAPLCMEMEGGK